MTSSIVVMFVLMFLMSIFTFCLQTRPRQPPCFPVLLVVEYILYPWEAISHRVSGSISSFSHVLETAQMSISCCIRYCWKSVNFRAKDLAFICERFSLNLSGICSIFLILLVLTSLSGTLYLWVVDTIMCIFLKRFWSALDLLYGFTFGCFLMPNAVAHDLVTMLRLKLVELPQEMFCIPLRNVDVYVVMLIFIYQLIALWS